MTRHEEKYIKIRLKDACESIFSGGTPDTRKPEYWGGEYLWLSSGETRNKFIKTAEKTITKDGVDNSSTRLAKIGDVLIASAGQGKTRGQTSYVLKDTYINQSIIALRANGKKMDSLYLFYLLSGKYDTLRNMSDANAIRGSLTCKMFESMELIVPEDVEIQKRIASLLFDYDSLIENNSRRIQILDNMAKMIYDDWFVKFKFPGYKTIKIIESETEFGEIPEGWEIKKLSDFAEITSSKRIYAKDYVESGVPFYRSKEIIQKYNYEAINTELFISRKSYDDIKSKFGVPKIGDILLTSVGTLGIPFLVNSQEEFYFKDGNLMWFKIYKKQNSEYIYYWIQSNSGKQNLLNTSIGTSQGAFTIVNIKQIKIIQPPKELCIEFSAIISKLQKRIELLVSTNKNLAATRNLLLPKLISGELDVSELDIKVPEVEA